jgi:hypothetical protein
MNGLHDEHAIFALESGLRRPISPLNGWIVRWQGVRFRRLTKEHSMRVHGQTITWGSQAGVGGASRSGEWYQQLREWWAAHRAVRQHAQLAACERRWDARREVVRPLAAEAAMDMAAAQGTLSMATRLYGLTI